MWPAGLARQTGPAVVSTAVQSPWEVAVAIYHYLETIPQEEWTGRMGMHVVVVEDEVFIRLDLLTHLQAGGHQVVGTADSRADAVQVVERVRPDLVLMDMRLIGEGDGIDAALEIWQRFGIRSLFVSANLDPGARAKAASANPVGFLEKPFTRTSLLAAVAAAR
jgi:CheY-like chemotaxis protein